MRFITVSAVIAALYAALTLLLQPVAYFGAAQCRLSEGLTLLAFLMPEAIPGLAVGCLAANILGGGALPDIILGTLATLAAAACSARVKNMWVSGIFPVLMLSDKSWKKSWLRMPEMRQSRWMSIFSFRKIL